MPFIKGQVGNPRGRPKGSKNISHAISDEMKDAAFKALNNALQAGEPWAIQLVLKNALAESSKRGCSE